MFREADEDESGFMCCAFSARERFLMLGTCTGQLKLYNVFTGQEEASYSCHSSAITHLEPSRVSRESYQYTSNFRLCLVVVAAACNLTCPLTCKIYKGPLHLKMCFAYWMFDLDCADSCTRVSFSDSSSEGGKFPCAPCVQYATYTSVIRKHTQRMDFSVKQKTSYIQWF